MKLFSADEINILSLYGLTPFPILHIREDEKKMPIKPIILKLQLHKPLEEDEKIIAVYEDWGGNKTQVDIAPCCIGSEHLTLKLESFDTFSR